MNTYAIIKDSVVVNIVEYGSQPTTPPPGFDVGHEAVKATGVSTGWTYANGVFIDTNPPVAVEMPPVRSLAEQIITNPTELAKLKLALGV